jgi:predicted nucleotidyltransferase
MDEYLNIVKSTILSLIDKNKVTVFLFGSRADNSCRHDSDVDVGFWANEELDNNLFSKINELLEESIVPYHIDLVDFSRTDEHFRKIALKNIEIWNKTKNFNLN